MATDIYTISFLEEDVTIKLRKPVHYIKEAGVLLLFFRVLYIFLGGGSYTIPWLAERD